ncbi:hypothetical protein QJ857_gp1228 [Tupanvirus soda lake]|uniref:Uncharacterized protein n=2 Tax=Tupanvirus TaxID=2094720 RepID=A0A6N1NT72_9VIRU|nr:hypothetical protein QJ857_gp1228 [Tupanvirus soda lake]QKU34828.1 hypothetical protein [Tupanvirus soda lake]
MSTNINRHAFVDFSAKPYIYHFGIPYQKQQYQPQNYNNQERTIIRTNQPNQNLTNSVPVNGMDNIRNYQNQFPNNHDENWSNFVRKDNMFVRYAANSCNNN